VPQSPPSLSQGNTDLEKLATEKSQTVEKESEQSDNMMASEEFVVFDPLQSFENFCNGLTSILTGNRLCLRIATQTLVFGNLLAFLVLYSLKSFTLMEEQHSLTVAIVSTKSISN